MPISNANQIRMIRDATHGLQIIALQTHLAIRQRLHSLPPAWESRQRKFRVQAGFISEQVRHHRQLQHPPASQVETKQPHLQVPLNCLATLTMEKHITLFLRTIQAGTPERKYVQVLEKPVWVIRYSQMMCANISTLQHRRQLR